MTRHALPFRAGWRALLLGAALTTLAATHAAAFDMAGYRTRLDAILAEAKAKAMADPKADLAKLDEMVALGKVGAQEYAAAQPKFARLMQAAIADAGNMSSLTDEEIEDKWGESGNAGDAVGVPLNSLGQFDATRAYLELMVSPSHAAIFVRKFAETHRDSWLDKTADELTELTEHLNQVQ